MKPLISIIIPARNSEMNLINLLDSLLDSNYKNFEIIINDDVISDDNTDTLCKEYESKGLKVIYKKENKSMTQGRERRVDFASGDTLLHLDSDMKITPNILSECELILNGAGA